jgi:hypothetical protein
MVVLRSLVLAFIFWSASLAGSNAVPAGPVDAAKTQASDGCTDGIGTTYRTDDLATATEDGTGTAFVRAHSACTEVGFLSGVSLLATCSRAVVGPTQEAFALYCRVAVTVPPQGPPLRLNADQYALVSNAGRYSPDAGLSVSIPEGQNLGARPIVAQPNSTTLAYLAFAIPPEERTREALLTWTMPGSARGELRHTRELKVLIAERDAWLAGFAALYSADDRASYTSNMPSSAPAPDSLSSNSNSVSEPMPLPAGTYVVSADYIGATKFAVWIHAASGGSDRLFDAVGIYSGQTTFTLDRDETVIFEITGLGGWVVETRPAFAPKDLQS